MRKLSIAHLYGDLMNTYGDDGNIQTIEKRCAWRGIETSVEILTVGDQLEDRFDFYFFGGGQDKAQEIVGKDLEGEDKKRALQKVVQQGSPLLAICGGYQLLAAYYQPFHGPKIPGLGIFPAHTVAGEKRMIGNLLIRLNPKIEHKIYSIYTGKRKDLSTLVGFENHSGKTYLADKQSMLGTVIAGHGNNGEDRTEGIWVENAFGCYLHGPLLPKNPHFADYLIAQALERRYGKTILLKPLDDATEWTTHDVLVRRHR